MKLTLTLGEANALPCANHHSQGHDITIGRAGEEWSVSFPGPRVPGEFCTGRVLYANKFKQCAPPWSFRRPAGTLKTRLSRKFGWFIIYHFPNMSLNPFLFISVSASSSRSHRFRMILGNVHLKNEGACSIDPICTSLVFP